MPVHVPSVALEDVFTQDVLRYLLSTRNPTPFLRTRLEILSASGPDPSDPAAADRVRLLRAQRAAWDVYIGTALELGFLDSDVRARLTGRDDAGFRSAMAECLGLWILAGKMGFSIHSRPAGRRGSVLEMSAALLDGPASCEVKAPYWESPTSGPFWGDPGRDELRRAVEQANGQFDEGCRNLLVVAPSDGTGPGLHRRTAVAALIGSEQIHFPVLREEGRLIGEPRFVFVANGQFTRAWDPGRPRFTRVSAMMTIEQTIAQAATGYEVAHRILVLHNPYAACPISPDSFVGFPQLVRGEGDLLVWTDTGSSSPTGE